MRLTQVVSNLLNNAAKFQDEGGWISITRRARGRQAVIRVADRGIGIPPELIDTVFDLFAQVERTMDRAEGGLGIGLSLVRNLVQMHGGRVAARERRPRPRQRVQRVRLPCVASDADRGHATRHARGRASARSRVCACSSSTTTATLPTVSLCC